MFHTRELIFRLDDVDQPNILVFLIPILGLEMSKYTNSSVLDWLKELLAAPSKLGFAKSK